MGYEIGGLKLFADWEAKVFSLYSKKWSFHVKPKRSFKYFSERNGFVRWWYLGLVKINFTRIKPPKSKPGPVLVK